MKKKILGVLIGLIALGCLGVGVFLYVSSNTTETATGALEKAMKNMIPDVEEISSLFSPINAMKFDKNGKYLVDGDISLTTGGQNISFSGKVYMDFASSQSYLDGTYGIGKNSFDLEALIKDQTVYMKVKEAFKNFYSIKLDEITEGGFDFESFSEIIGSLEDSSLTLTEEQQNRFIKLLTNSILDNVKDNDFKKSEEELTLGDTKVNATKYDLEITEQLIKEILLDFLKGVKDDKEIVAWIEDMLQSSPFTSLATEMDVVGGMSEMANEVEENEEIDFASLLDEAIKALEGQEASSEVVMNFTMYVKKKDIVRYVFAIPEAVSITIDDYENSKGYENFEIAIRQGDSVLGSFTINETEKNTKKFDLSINAQQVFYGTYTKTDAKINVDLSFSIDSFEGSLKYTHEVVKKNEQENLKLTLFMDDGENDLSILMDMAASPISKLPEVDVSGSKDFDSITEEELNAFEKIFEGSANNVDDSDSEE